MISPKEKVRANIYKQLLEEEKRKGKKISVMSLSLFVIGMFTGKSIDYIKTQGNSNINSLVYQSNEDKENKIEIKIDELFQVDQIKVKENKFNTENLFVSEIQI